MTWVVKNFYPIIQSSSEWLISELLFSDGTSTNRILIISCKILIITVITIEYRMVSNKSPCHLFHPFPFNTTWNHQKIFSFDYALFFHKHNVNIDWDSLKFNHNLSISSDWKLTNFRPMLPFYTPWKHQKTKSFLVFSGGIKWENWREMG